MALPEIGARDHDDAWLEAPFGWRWPLRYLLGAAILGALAAAIILLPWRSSGALWWLPLLAVGGVAIYALAIMREALVALLALGALWLAWYFAKDFGHITWAVIGGIALVAYIGHLQDQTTRRLQRQIDNLQQQVNRLSGDPWA